MQTAILKEFSTLSKPISKKPPRSVLVSLKAVSKTFFLAQKKVEALKSITLEVYDGEFISVLGPSGSGKSTLLHILGFLARPSEGAVVFRGENISSLGEKKLASLRSQKIGFVFQSFHLLPTLSALENVELPLIYQHVGFKTRRARALEALEKVNLLDRQDHFPRQLSGGECQRVAIARALVSSPSLILADEPTGNLDSQTGKEILEVLKTFHQKGVTLVLVTHDASIAHEAERKIYLRDGRMEK
ncbi:MAG: ABC transporter ATP-binding protein [Chlamydiae bacterium]|nr:ABC transporter ATP-binding protein [Chlamydiota bacterium]MBI3277982.1 ABC transporter ATP-binding protein [Chlamydiota bacterium]